MIMERKCANCANGTWCDGTSPITDVCIQCRYVDVNGKPQPSNWKPQPMTNGDRIRAMSDEEFARVLIEYRDDWGDYVTHNGIFDELKDALKAEIEWLQQSAEV